MIATVRIAPVEQWCDYPKSKAEEWRSLVGTPVEIYVEHMRVSTNERGEKYREWPVTEKTKQSTKDVIGGNWRDDMFVCEHMLEMD